MGTRASQAGEPPQNAHLRAVNVDDVRSNAPAEPGELGERQRVVPRVDRPADMTQLDVPGSRSLGRIAQRPRSLRRERHLELTDEPGQQQRHRRLRTTQLAERDQHEQSGLPVPHLPR